MTLEMGGVIAKAFPKYARNAPKFELPDLLTRFLALFDPNLKMALIDLGCRYTVDPSYVTELTGVNFRPAEDAIVAMGSSLI